MVAYSFKAQFANSVESGRKIQTIRADRKNGHASAGDRLQLYTGMRTKDCRKLRPDPLCLSVEPIKIKLSTATGLTTVIIGGQYLNACQALAFAQADGFDSVEAMGKFFQDTHGLPFEGFLIKWEPLWRASLETFSTQQQAQLLDGYEFGEETNE